MKTKCVGITAEYNPFHNGHLYHLNESVKASGAQVVIAAMSGNFVQRGGFAMADKWQRAEAAIRCGVDVALEIPAVFACSSAQSFAAAGVEILENMGADFISFGSESGNIGVLREITRAIKERSPEIEEFIKQKTKEGVSYPRARREAVFTMLGEESAKVLDSPNNILAIEYLKNIKKAEVITVERKGTGHNDLDTRDGFASATALRYMINENKDVSGLLPAESADIISRAQPPDKDAYFRMICTKALELNAEDMDKAPAGGEGLANKLKNSVRTCRSAEELSEALKSKRYTRTRIDRFLSQILLGIDRNVCPQNYIRVLAMSSKGAAYLKEIKKAGTCSLPVVTNINKALKEFPHIEYSLSKDILAADLYNIAAARDLYRYSEYVQKPYVGR